MKIRQGFVSNSSTASFIVKMKDWFAPNKKTKALLKKLINKDQEKVLKKLGFKKINGYYPDHVCQQLHNRYNMSDSMKKLMFEEGFKDYCRWPKIHSKKQREDKLKEYTYLFNNTNSYGMHVDCNQSDIIIELFKHKIPFIADVHYDQYSYLYRGGEYYFMAPNLGKLMLMSCNDKQDISGKRQKLSIKKYIKDNTY